VSEILRGAQKGRGGVWPGILITFLRGRRASVGVPLAAALALFGCAPARPPVSGPRAAVAAPAGPGYATVAAVRPISAIGGAGGGPDAAILPAMGISSEAAPASGALSEIVVRTDGGETLSVVQPNAINLAPGERVMIVPGGLPRVVPAPSSS
jgi:hypothetical protein